MLVVSFALSQNIHDTEGAVMQEARFMVPSSKTMEEHIKPALIAAGAVCRGWYGLTDIIFCPEKDYNAGFVRLRIARNARNASPRIVLVQKETAWGHYSKTDTIVVREEFADIMSANEFMKKEFGGALRMAFAFSRDGTEYALDGLRIFTEDILVPSIRWSVEIEGAGDIFIAGCAALLGLGQPIRDSVPALVHKHLGSRTTDEIIRLFK